MADAAAAGAAAVAAAEVVATRPFTLAMILSAGALCAPALSFAQTFAAASIRPTAPGNSEPIPEFDIQPGRLVVGNASLRDVIIRAYGVPAFRLEGGPPWMTTARFDILATTEARVTSPEVTRMLRALLVERFALRVRTVTRELPLWELRMARGDGRPGPQLKPPTRDCAAAARQQILAVPRPNAEPDPCALQSRMKGGTSGILMTWTRAGVPMSVLATMLEGPARRFVVDRTGLAGNFDIELSWSPDAVKVVVEGPELPTIQNTPIEGFSLRTALRDQLGLRLESARGPVEVLVIDGASQPTAN